jgi:hypothetical protein
MFVSILTSRAAHKSMVSGVPGFEEPLVHRLGLVALDPPGLSKPFEFVVDFETLQLGGERPEKSYQAHNTIEATKCLIRDCQNENLCISFPCCPVFIFELPCVDLRMF